MRINPNSKKGFTLVEMLAVITLLGVVAAVSTPLVGRMFDEGNNTNRSMIARTIYTSAQNQLTEKRILQSLSGFAANANIKNEEHLVYKGDRVTNLEELTGEGKADASSKQDVYYISKPKGEKSGPVYDLLSPVIQQKDILSNSILIEFNVKTGVVLSVFYSDEVADGETLQYMAAGSNDVKNVTGKRPYEYADKRKQGYYGVDATGVNESREATPMMISIKDGNTEALQDTQGHQYKNVLYADILIPTSLAQSGMKYTLKLDNKNFISGYDFTTAIDSISLSTDLSSKSGNIIYKLTSGVEEGYSRFIWLIDYVGGDMSNSSGNLKHSIGVKYPTMSSYTGGNVFAEVQAEFSAISARSLTYVNPLFATKDSYADGTREINNARHLFNVRYSKNGSFIQTADIDLDEEAITGFTPIGSENEPFTGTYDGGKHVIKNLKISNPQMRNAGFFGVVQGELEDMDRYKAASVKNLVLQNPSVVGSSNVGSIAGTSMGLIDSVYVSFDKDFSILGDYKVGGIVGQNSGIVKNSVLISNTDKYHIKLSDNEEAKKKEAHLRGIGGFAGHNEGKLEYCMFLAKAPESNRVIFPFVSIDNASSNAYEGLYYLSGVGVRPTGNYNVKAAYNAIGTPVGSKYAYFIQMPDVWKRTLKADGSQYNSTEMDNQVSNVYPYPYIFSENLLTNWPVVNNTEKPPQVERPSVKTSTDERLRKNNINFINSDFEILHKNTEENKAYRNADMMMFSHRDNVPGWNTRPTQGGTPKGYDEIEFQRSRKRYDFAKLDYKGNKGGWYAELNAHVPGTLYQICDTVPGDEVYYSFYHHARSSEGGKTLIADGSAYQNKMNFYLSPMKLENGDYKYTNGKVLIRPCWVRRDKRDTTDNNFKANKIFHGREKDHIDYGGGWNLPYFGLTKVYLYDIWGGTSGKYANMGVTFYSYTPVNNLGVDKIIESNIIGYWDVANGWKRYYGFYKVPEGQNLTEFAYESQTLGALSEGNFLDGIKLSTPSQLVVGNSVSKNYVSPNETLRITFSIKNVGEASAKDVELTDSFQKFINYFQYYGGYPGNLVVRNETQNKVLVRNRDYKAKDMGDSFKFNIPEIRGITERREAGETAAETEGGDTITVSFDVKVRSHVLDNNKPTNYSTIGYYFDNQAVVTYRDKGFDGYSVSPDVKKVGVSPEVRKTSVSPDVRVQISPVKFEKTVVEKTSEYNKFDEDGNAIQFFEVTVKYGGKFLDSSNNPMTIFGTLEEFLLPGFKLTEASKVGIKKNVDEIINPNDGSTTLRITINDVASNDYEKQIKYVLEYRGKSSGVLPVSTQSRYTYSAYSEKTDEYYVNKLYVASPSVGIRLKTVNSGSMSVNVGATQNLKFLANSTDKYLKNIVNLGDYDVGAYKVVFTDQNGNAVNTTDANGNSQITSNLYEATVLRDGDGDTVISFKAKAAMNAPQKLYYKLVLSAIDIQNPSSKMVLDSRVTSVDVSTNHIPTESKTTEVTDKYKDVKDANGNPIQHFEVSLSAWGANSLKGTFTDVINSGFEVTESSLAELKKKYPSASVTKNADGTSTLVIPDYQVKSEKTPVVYTVKYTGDGYGALRISKSTTVGIEISGSRADIDIYRGEVILKPKTKDHNVDVVVGEPVTISGYIDEALIAEAKKLQTSGYQIGSYAVSLVNEKGYERRYNLTDFAAVRGINNNITATVFSDKKAPYYIYYVLKFNVTDGDGKHAQLLVSRPTKIILNIKK